MSVRMIADQLALACRSSGARWGVWVKHTERQWFFSQHYSVSAKLEGNLAEYLARPAINSWLSGSFNTRRPRSRALVNDAKRLGCTRLYAFVHPTEARILLVGAEQLESHHQDLFKILAIGAGPAEQQLELPHYQPDPVDPSFYLQQLSLMNELAMAAADDVDTIHAARRVVEWLCQAFHTNLAAILMISDDGNNLIEYGTRFAKFPLVIPIAASLSGYVVETQKTVRIGEISQAPRWLQHLDDVNSVLAVPMKYAGQTIGVVIVENSEKNWFSMQDEDFLTVVASQVAGMLVHVEAQQSQRDWATKLNLIHQVVKQIVGLTDKAQITKMVASLSKDYFGFEIAVGLDGDNGPEKMEKTQEICIPLRDGERSIGTLCAITANGKLLSRTDELLLESLAGILSSVLMNASRYTELQEKINQLQLVRKVALDIVSDLDLDVLLTGIVHQAREMVHAKGAELGIYETDAQAVRVIINETPWYHLKGHLIPPGKGLAGQVLLRGEPVKVDDYNPWSERLWPGTVAPFKAVAGVPLKYKGETMGTLVVMDDQPERIFSDEDVQLLELLAPSIVVSLRNAELYQELQERIEAQQLAESRLIQAEKMAVAGKLMAAIAHEVNNPLQSLSNCLYLVDHQELSISERQNYLNMARSELDRLSSTVQRMLDLFRPGGRDRRPTNINDLINRVVELLEGQLRDKAIDVLLELKDNLPSIMVVPNQIHQVLLNLILNAVDAMPGGGQIEIKSNRAEWVSVAKITSRKSKRIPSDCGVEILIRDNGPGVPREQQEHVFEPFVSTKETGTGLGLTVSYEIIQAYGGSLSIIDDGKPGACFRIAIPEEQKT